MPKPHPTPVVTSTWTRQAKPGQIDSLRAALRPLLVRAAQR